jgi:glucose/arabinose dehydrogenase
MIAILGLADHVQALPLEQLQLPPGYRIEIAAEVPNARQMALSPEGILYVGTRRDGRVFALEDRDDDQRYETRHTLLSGRRLPNGVVWSEGDLYIAELTQLIRLTDIDSRLDTPPTAEVRLEIPQAWTGRCLLFHPGRTLQCLPGNGSALCQHHAF